MTPAKLHSVLGITWNQLEALAAVVGRHYSSFDSQIVYRDGKHAPSKFRHIDNPTKELRKVQDRILGRILRRSALPELMYGAKKGGSIIEHARHHEGRECVLTVDLASCYPRTTFPRIYDEFARTFSCIPDVARVLTQLTTFQRRLPQGAATSGYLAHLILRPLFFEIRDVCRRHSLRVSFFMDDIAISGRIGAVRAVTQEVIMCVQRHGFSISARKKRFMVGPDRQVTGLSVGERVAIPESYLTALETELVQVIRRGEMTISERDSLDGKITWVRQVSPERAEELEALFRYAPDATTGPESKFLKNIPCTDSQTCRAPRWAPAARRSTVPGRHAAASVP